MTGEFQFTRTETVFVSHGTLCAATVFRPDGENVQAGAPVVVMAHGFAGARAHRLDAYAAEFAQAGYLVVVFDYRGWGDSDGLPRHILSIPGQLDDWRAALRFGRALPGADPARIVAWGTSFSGGHVITLAASGEPLAALIVQVPHISGPAAVRARGLLSGIRLLPAAIEDTVRGVLGREPRYIGSVGRPGDLAVLTSPDAVPGLARMEQQSGLDGSQYPRTVAARIVARIGFYSPGRRAAAVACPALVQVARTDVVTSAATARRAAARMPAGTVREYDLGHFDCYVHPAFPTIVTDQLNFLKTTVPLR
ncbi:alpha/beta hydrolase [Nocardia carnea]|uniref:alpha/beta hydrolase n=1 Tax=Nocardia carnea TaxID=37328 RepID=UPI0024588B50|nr:alpha/beta hydrolase [Nocardia carnea]